MALLSPARRVADLEVQPIASVRKLCRLLANNNVVLRAWPCFRSTGICTDGDRGTPRYMKVTRVHMQSVVADVSEMEVLFRGSNETELF